MPMNWGELKFGPFLIVIVVIIIGIFLGQIITGFSFKIPIALILGAFILIVTLVNTDAGLAILIFSMLLSPELILGQVPGRDIVIRFDDILLAIITFAWFAKTAINKGLVLFIKTPLNRAIGVYIFICLAATLKGAILGHVSAAKGLFYILRYFEYFLLYILVANHIHSKKQIKFFLNAFFITCALVSVYGILQIPRGIRVSAPFEGEVSEPNTFGGYLLIIFCLTVGLLLQNIPNKLKIKLFGLTILIFIPFLFTLSRASYVAIIFSYLTFIILSKRKAILIFALATMLLSVILLRPEAVISRVKYTFQKEQGQVAKIGNVTLDPSSSARIFSWLDAFKTWKKNPILGRGVSGFLLIDGQYIVNLVELGIVGFFALLWLLWTIFKHSFNIHKQMDDELYKGLTLGFLAGFIGIVFHALTANSFIILRIMEPFWFLAAIVMMLPTLEEEEEKGEKIEIEKGEKEISNNGVKSLLLSD
ncbi:MAG: O-antigen ligase family protein [Candidatus Aminicenantes bacterium]|nr:O-antigen ligase family protein [Candidatus Aminicenantes bacterium]